MPQSCTIGIDVGTTSVKVIAVNDHGEQVSYHKVVIPIRHTDEGGAEQEAPVVYEAVMQALRIVVDDVVGKFDVGQIGFSAAMHSVLAVDESGVPLSSAWTWMDLRAKQQSARLWLTPEGKDMYRRTGTPIHPMTMAMKLLWMHDERPDMLHHAAKFVSLKEWIWFRWFGLWQIDESMASTTGLYATDTRTWNEAIMQSVSVKAQQLSDIVPTTYCAQVAQSPVLQSLGLRAGTSVNIGATDGVLANLGVGAITPRTMVITIGTSCALRATVDSPATHPETRSFCYVLSDGKYVIGGPSNSGGVSVEQMYRQIMGGMAESELPLGLTKALQDAGTVDTGNLICLPYVAGERAPLWNPDATAAWIGVELHHQPVHLLRSVVEGVLYNAYWIATGLFEQIGKPERLMASGGLLDVEWIRQTLADVFGIPVEYDNEGDASAVGAARLAELATGMRTWDDAGHAKQEQIRHRPDWPRHTEHLAKFERFKNTVMSLGLMTADAN
ncbi:gluconokinase [Alicyclobacillus curvatus]|nr:gluconokinase [Alicyclobacillus curvatus]